MHIANLLLIIPHSRLFAGRGLGPDGGGGARPVQGGGGRGQPGGVRPGGARGVREEEQQIPGGAGEQ